MPDKRAQKLLDDLMLALARGQSMDRHLDEARRYYQSQIDRLLTHRAELDATIRQLRDGLRTMEQRVAAAQGGRRNNKRASTKEKYDQGRLVYLFLATPPNRGARFVPQALAHLTGGWRLSELVEVYNREAGDGERIRTAGGTSNRTYWVE